MVADQDFLKRPQAVHFNKRDMNPPLHQITSKVVTIQTTITVNMVTVNMEVVSMVTKNRICTSNNL